MMLRSKKSFLKIRAMKCGRIASIRALENDLSSLCNDIAQLGCCVGSESEAMIVSTCAPLTLQVMVV